MFKSSLLVDIRKNLGIKQVDLYRDIISKVSYYKFEKGEKDISIEDIQKLCERLSMRPAELLYRTDVTRDASLPFWEEKISLADHLQTEEQFFSKYSELRSLSNDSIGYFSVFLACAVLGKTKGYIKEFDIGKKTFKELSKHFTSRKELYAVHYEIIANLVYFLPDFDISKLIEKAFPILKSQGDVFDTTAQIALKNLISYYLEIKNIEKSKYFIKEYEKIRHISGFNIHNSLNLEVLYLQYLCSFYEKRNINDFLEASKIVNIIKQLGYYKVYNNLINEISGIAEKENFALPNELHVITNPYSN